MKKIAIFASMILFLGVSLLHAEEEEFSITTYYPSPFGSYNELEIRRSITYTPVNKDDPAFWVPPPQDGELIYNVDKKFWYYNGTERKWKDLGGSPRVVPWVSGVLSDPCAWSIVPTVATYNVPPGAIHIICTVDAYSMGSSGCIGGSIRVLLDGTDFASSSSGGSCSATASTGTIPRGSGPGVLEVRENCPVSLNPGGGYATNGAFQCFYVTSN